VAHQTAVPGGSTGAWRRTCLSRDPWFGLSVDVIERFLDELITEQGLCGSTCAAYRAELHKLDSWLQRRARCTLVSASDTQLLRYLVGRAAISANALSRAIRTMRRFYTFLHSKHCRDDDPMPRPVEISWSPGAAPSHGSDMQVPCSDVRGARELRDDIVRSLALSTGLRTTDLLDVRTSDLHLESGYMMIGPMRRARMVLLSTRAVDLLQWFLENARSLLLTRGGGSTYVFPTSGSRKIAQDAVLSDSGLYRRRQT
jgi:integrase/recombinase XerD